MIGALDQGQDLHRPSSLTVAADGSKSGRGEEGQPARIIPRNQPRQQGDEPFLSRQAGRTPDPVQPLAGLLHDDVAAAALEDAPRRLKRDRPIVADLLADTLRKPARSMRPLSPPGSSRDLSSKSVRATPAGMSATCTATICPTGRLRTVSSEPPRGHHVPNVQQQADVGGGDHVQQQRQGVQVVDELECLVLAEELGRPEAQAQADPGRLQGPANLLKTAAVELEVLVIGPLVAGRGQGGHAAGAVRPRRPPGPIPAASPIPAETSLRRCPRSTGKGKVPRRIFALSIKPPGIGHALEPRPGGKIDHVQVDAPKTVSQGQLDDFALMTG